MWYPEEPATYCPHCDTDIPIQNFWRGHGYCINAHGRQERIRVLYSLCPECGGRRSAGLEGPWWYRTLYEWLWRLRYPRRKAPRGIARAAEPSRRRVAGE